MQPLVALNPGILNPLDLTWCQSQDIADAQNVIGRS